MVEEMGDTIAAIATAMQKSAIGIIRLSGDDAFLIAERVFYPKNGRPLSKQPARQIIYGELRSISAPLWTTAWWYCQGSEELYGENTVSFNVMAHLPLTAALRALFEAGARQAKAGEFTARFKRKAGSCAG